MRAFTLLPALAILSTAQVTRFAHETDGPRLAADAAVHATAGRELIVQVASRTAPTGVASARRSDFAARMESLGLRVTRSLEEGIPRARSGRNPSRSDPPRVPFDLDPARVFLLEAAHADAARAALAVLASDREIEWVELNRVREPAELFLGPLDEQANAVEAPHARASGPAHHAAPAALGFPDDPMFQDSRQWGLRNLGPGGAYGGVAGADIHALEAWSFTTGDNDLRLAVADTGIDPDHPDLQARSSDGGMRIQLAINLTTDPSHAVADSFGHGTRVAGVMAALTHNGPLFDSLGVAGVCGGDGRGNLGCRIVPIKIAPGHASAATSFDISRAILYATRVGARAMNLSYAGLGASRLERLALYHAITHGCVVVAAAGNFGNVRDGAVPVYPAAYAAEGLCIQAGASDVRDQRAAFSSHGPGLDLLAPGQKIWTTSMTYPNWAGIGTNGYLAASGTSFSAPHVTGAVGLLAALRPELMDSDFQQVLRESADDVGTPGYDLETGWGRMNVGRALASVRSVGVWHDEVAAGEFHTRRMDSLVVGETGWGNLERARLWPLAELVEARATVTLPDSFLDSVRVWPRVGGTTTIRGDFRIPYFAPWARVEWVDGRTFALHGYLFHLVGCHPCTGPDDATLPLPPDQVRFGFTVIGRVHRSTDHAVSRGPGCGDSPRTTIEPMPNPFRGSLRIDAPPGLRMIILDITGRVLRRLEPAAGACYSWDGRDERGMSVRPGLYWVRCEDAAMRMQIKVVKLE